jgi:hypothetical protein
MGFKYERHYLICVSDNPAQMYFSTGYYSYNLSMIACTCKYYDWDAIIKHSSHQNWVKQYILHASHLKMQKKWKRDFLEETKHKHLKKVHNPAFLVVQWTQN